MICMDWSRYSMLFFSATTDAESTWDDLFSNSLKGKRKFSTSRTCSRMICWIEIKLQFSFRKYISICTVCTVLIRLILAFLYDLHWTHGGSNSSEKPTASGTKVEQWSLILLPIGKSRAVDNMFPFLWGWHFDCSACAYRAINREWCNKNIQCDNI